MRLLEEALLVGDRARERALLGGRRARSRGSSPAIAPQLTGTNALCRRRALRIQRACDELLSRSALARDQHRAVACGKLLHRAQHLPHGGADADDLVRAVDLGAQFAHFARERPTLGRTPDGDHQPFRVDRLRQVVVRPRLDGGDGILDGAVRGRHDDLGLGSLRVNRLEQARAVERALHPNVGDHDIERSLRQQRERVRRGRGLVHAVAVLLEQHRHRPSDVRLILDEQHVAGGVRHGRNGTATTAIGSVASGSANVNRPPRPGTFSTSRAPPWSRTIRATIGSPRPVPCAFVV